MSSARPRTLLAPLLLIQLAHRKPHIKIIYLRKNKYIWSVLKSPKCHKQGQYSLALKYTQILIILLWKNLPVNYKQIKHYLHILQNYYPHLAPPQRATITQRLNYALFKSECSPRY